MNDRINSLLQQTIWQSPLGAIRLIASDTGLVRLEFCADSPDEALPVHPVLGQAIGQLAAYFAGERHSFDVPLDLIGTPFQREVWAAVYAIPWGQTRSYHEIAVLLGRSTAVRAVGAANGANPVSIIVPCHRVIASDGSLRGYSGGLERKRWLLKLENADFKM